MNRTRLSLFYLAGYLSFTGVALILVPELTLRLLFASGQYGDVMPRFSGVLMLGLGMIVAQLIRHRAEALYPTTLAVRLMILVCVTGIYIHSKDPFFLVVLGVVALGVMMTGSAYLSERKR
jgi:uncharacterized membrane protein YoaK (UPF0700 family)